MGSSPNLSHSLSPHPEPFGEDATETGSFPPYLPPAPPLPPVTTSPPVLHTSSISTSSYNSSNTTTGPSGESQLFLSPSLSSSPSPSSFKHFLVLLSFHPPLCLLSPFVSLPSPSSLLQSAPLSLLYLSLSLSVTLSLSPAVMSVSMSTVCLSHVSKAVPKAGSAKGGPCLTTLPCITRSEILWP